jgi:hypothetical protein
MYIFMYIWNICIHWEGVQFCIERCHKTGVAHKNSAQPAIMIKMPLHQNNEVAKAKKHAELSNSAHKSIILRLKPLFKDGEFGYGVLTRVGKEFRVHHSTYKKYGTSIRDLPAMP